MLLEELGVEGFWEGQNNSFVKLYIVFSINQNIMTFYLILNETMLILEATEFSKV